MAYLISSVEGNRQRLDGGSMFGNCPRALWARWIEPDERHRIPLACRGFLVEDHQRDRRILLDTGIGCFFEPRLRDRYGVTEPGHRLLATLADRGVSPEEIDVVVLSHLHFDHAGGLLTAWREDAEPQLVFPNARILVSASAWQRATHPHRRDRASFIPQLHRLLERSGRLELLDDPQGPHPLGAEFSYTLSEGHTPGLMLTRLAGERSSVAFCADLIPGVPWIHLPITMGYDRFPERLVDEKLIFLKRCLDESTLLLFAHDPRYAATRVATDHRGRYRADRPQRRLDSLEL